MIHVRSNVPAHLFSGIERVQFHAMRESLDPGVVEEADSLGVDVAATLGEIERYHHRRAELVAEEARWVERTGVSLVVADFPHLAGEIATMCSLPCVGIGNFTWNWIYEPFFQDRGTNDLLHSIRDGYSRMDCWLRLPFNHNDEGLFRRVVDMPLVARRPRLKPADVLRQLSIESVDCRPRIVLAMRGRIPRAARAAAADANPDWLFLHFDSQNVGSHGNERAVTLSPELLFTDVLNVCEVAVSKYGYGMVSECIGRKKRLLCPPRRSFREDEVFDRDIDRQLRIARISRDDFLVGRWSEAIRWLLDQDSTEPTLPIDGADACAREISKVASGD